MRVGFYNSLLITLSEMTGIKSSLFADLNFYDEVDCTNLFSSAWDSEESMFHLV